MIRKTPPKITDSGCRAGKEFTRIRMNGVNFLPHPCKVGGGMAEDDLINIILMHPPPHRNEENQQLCENGFVYIRRRRKGL